MLAKVKQRTTITKFIDYTRCWQYVPHLFINEKRLEMETKSEEFKKLLEFVDKETDWKVNLDTTNDMVVDAFLNSKQFLERLAV